jgi:hypothetical protein
MTAPKTETKTRTVKTRTVKTRTVNPKDTALLTETNTLPTIPSPVVADNAVPEVKTEPPPLSLDATIAALVNYAFDDGKARKTARKALVAALATASGQDADTVGKNVPQDIGSFFRVLAGLDKAPDTAREAGTKDAEKRGAAAASMSKAGDAGAKAAAKYNDIGTAGGGAAAYMIGRLAHGRAATAADGAALNENVSKVTGYRTPVKARE